MIDRKRARELEIWLKQRFPKQRITQLQKTKLCLDGYPRSANSLLFRKVLATSGYTEPDLTHHIHVRQNVECAVLAGIPAIMPVREPLACMTSFLVYTNGHEDDALFKRYRSLIALAAARREAVTIALFDEITSDYAAVVARANRMHGDILPAPAMSDDALNRQIQEQVDQENFHKDKAADRTGAPDPAREEKKEQYKTYVMSHAMFAECALAFRRAEKIAAKQ